MFISNFYSKANNNNKKVQQKIMNLIDYMTKLSKKINNQQENIFDSVMEGYKWLQDIHSGLVKLYMDMTNQNLLEEKLLKKIIKKQKTQDETNKSEKIQTLITQMTKDLQKAVNNFHSIGEILTKKLQEKYNILNTQITEDISKKMNNFFQIEQKKQESFRKELQKKFDNLKTQMDNNYEMFHLLQEEKNQLYQEIKEMKDLLLLFIKNQNPLNNYTNKS